MMASLASDSSMQPFDPVGRMVYGSLSTRCKLLDFRSIPLLHSGSCRHPQTWWKQLGGHGSRRRWDKPNARYRCLLDSRPAVKHRDVLAARPQRCKVAVVRRAGIAGLPGGVDADAVIPVADVDDQPHRGAGDAAKIADAVACMHRRRVAATHR